MAEQTLVICFPQDGMNLGEPMVRQSYDNDEVKGSSASYWRRHEIITLLELYRKYQPELNTTHYRDKSRIWGLIAKEMAEVGYSFSGFACHKKFRNMKTRYKSIAETMLKKGLVVKPTWPYFSQMEDILSLERETIPASLEDAMTTLPSEEGENSMIPASTLMHWGRREILLLLEAYQRHRGQVSATRHRDKPEIWQNVARELEQHGYIVSAAACVKKFRNMANHFRSIVKTVSRSGGAVKPTWEYFHIMEKLVHTEHLHASSAEESAPYQIDNPDSSECTLDLDVVVVEPPTSVEAYEETVDSPPSNTTPRQAESPSEQHSVSDNQRSRKRRRPNRGFGGLVEMLERKLDRFSDIMEDQNRLMRERNELLRQKVEIKRQRLEWEKRLRR